MAVRLFVGNLAYGVTEAELKELFSAVAAPALVRLPTDRETGKPRGFGFVEFSDRSHAEEAVRRFNQQLFKGRPLAVNEARERGEAGPVSRPNRPSRPEGTGWLTGLGGEDAPRINQPRRTFGPDAPPRGKRKPDARAAKAERAPKGPLRERAGGQFFAGDVDDSQEEDLAGDDFSLWAKDKSETTEED